MRQLLVTGLLAAALAGPVSARQVTPARAERRSADGAVHIWDIPFELSAGKIFLQVKVNGQGPYPFVLDTGSPPTVVDMDLAKELGIRVSELGEVSGAGEGGTAMGGADAVELSFGGITIPSRPMMAIAINKRLAAFNGRPVMGLIGNDFVTSHIVEVDYPGRRLIVRDQKGWTYHGSGVVIPTRTQGHTYVRGELDVGGEKLRCGFVIDSGAGLVMSLNTPFVNSHDLLDKLHPPLTATVGYGLGGEVRHPVARVHAVRIGSLEIDRPVCTLSQDKAGALAGRQWDGLIGGELLSRYRVIFDSPRHRMILEPGPGADRPMEFDMSGLALKGLDDGPLTVYRVIDGSPAAKAGVREGDEILTIDGAAVTGRDRDRVRAMLIGDGTERTLRIRRGEREREVEIKLRRLVMRDRTGDAPVVC